VLGAFAVTSPSAVSSAASVKVPPTSTPSSMRASYSVIGLRSSVLGLSPDDR
jgi:hypothetical protein